MPPGVFPVNYMQCVDTDWQNWKNSQNRISTELKNSQFFKPVGTIAKVQTKVAHRLMGS